jgi:2-polyprenyl-3-methyl-5-hydroxy-6-metoxy-1,4-benzoquinol methylase
MNGSTDWWRIFYEELFGLLGDDVSDDQVTQAELAWIIGTAGLRPGNRVLDVGAGLGRIAVGLARLGLDVTGTDISDAFLDHARRRAQGVGRNVRFVPADMRRLDAHEDLQGPFDAAVMMDSVSGIFPREQTCEVLKSVRQRLHPGGMLMLSQLSPNWARQEHRWIKPLSGGRLLRRQTHWNEAEHRLRDEVVVTGFQGEEVERLPAQLLYLYDPPALEALARDAGFESVQVNHGPAAGSALSERGHEDYYLSARRPPAADQ